MKKIFALFLCITCLISFVGISSFAAETNLLLNGSFEEGNENWNGVSGAEWNKNIFVSAEKRHEGKNALKIDATSGNLIVQQRVNVKANSEIKVEGWYLKTDEKAFGQLKIEFYDAVNTFLGDANKSISPDDANAWQKFTHTFIVPQSASYMNVQFRGHGGAVSFYDDIAVCGEAPKTETEEETLIEGPVEELLVNGDVEQGSANWNAANAQTVWNTSLFVDTEKAHSGTNSIKMVGDDNRIIMQQKIYVVAGASYTISGWYLREVTTTRGQIKVEFYDAAKNYLAESVKWISPESSDWSRIEFTLEAPKKTEHMQVQFRIEGTGANYWDDMSVMGVAGGVKPIDPADLGPAPKYPVATPLPGAQNLIVNPGFEELGEDGMPSDWRNKGAKYCSLETKDVHAGKNAIKITGQGDTSNPWFFQKVAVKGNTPYQLSFWTKYLGSADPGGTVKLEIYAGEEKVHCGPESGHTERYGYGDWFLYTYQFTTVPDCTQIEVFLRLTRGNGQVWFDDVELIQIGEQAPLDLRTDQIFYYSEWGNVNASATATRAENADKYVKFRLLDGETVITESAIMPLNGQITKKDAPASAAPHFSFDIDLMAEYMKEYTMEAQLCEADGTVIDAVSTDIYRSARPTRLTERGDYIGDDGEIMIPVIGYHVFGDDYPNLAKYGINVAQSGYVASPSAALTILNKAQQYNVKLLLQLYWDMNPAGSPTRNAAVTEEIVKAVKDHPALFGYMQMDEPGDQTCDWEAMKEGYRIMRSLDTEHPVYACEYHFYGFTAKYTDMISIDPYPRAEDKVVTLPYAEMNKGNVQMEYKKPLYCVIQAFEYDALDPTYDDVRAQIYQGLYAGVQGVGYYALDGSSGGKPVQQTPVFEAITDFNVMEKDILFKHFIKKEGAVFGDDNGTDYRYHIWVDGNDLYAMVVDADNVASNISIPLTSYDGSVTVGGFTATPISMKDAQSFTGNGTLTYPLAARQGITFKITPTEKVDFGTLSASKYSDLTGYNWARKEISVLSEKNIVNDLSQTSFGPGKNITRGDLAYFLIRTLGLTAETTDNFADVDANAHYAKELAVGRALGILQGVGENKYNPEAEITRQDLMTIIARGMKLTGVDGALSAFSDAGLVADYALESVQAMVASGLVKGNADGTLNPLGQATRAESACIMYRILNK